MFQVNESTFSTVAEIACRYCFGHIFTQRFRSGFAESQISAVACIVDCNAKVHVDVAHTY